MINDESNNPHGNVGSDTYFYLEICNLEKDIPLPTFLFSPLAQNPNFIFLPNKILPE